MSKIWLIIKREYLTRVRKRAFIIITLIGPLLFSGIMLVPIWLAQMEDTSVKTIAVVEYDRFGKPVPDSLLRFKGVIPQREKLKFQHLNSIDENTLETLLRETDAFFGILKLKHNVLFSGDKVPAELIAKKQPSMAIMVHIEKSLEQFIHDTKLLTYNVPPHVLKSIQTEVEIVNKRLKKSGGIKEQKNIEIKIALGYLSGFMIYMFIFMFSSQVMRGVIEEKVNRIIEVIITSVKPIQLLTGKIVGISFLGITQLLVWIILTFGIFQVGKDIFIQNSLTNQVETNQPSDLFGEGPNTSTPKTENSLVELSEAGFISVVQSIPFGLIIVSFFFFFIGGYLLYASFFAGIGSAVDNETDTQQFMLPVTLPLILSLIILSAVITNPESQIAEIFSYIPFTSPIIMMARIPFEIVSMQEIIISLVLLYLTVFLSIWVSSRIYRVGILMYGKKSSFREIIKWASYKVDK